MAADQLTHCLFSNLTKYLIGWYLSFLMDEIHSRTISQSTNSFFPYSFIYAQCGVLCDMITLQHTKQALAEKFASEDVNHKGS